MHYVWVPYISPIKKRVIGNPSNEADFEHSNVMPGDEIFNWTRQNYVDFVTLTTKDDVIPILVSQATIVGEDSLTDKKLSAVVELRRVGLTLSALYKSWLKMTQLIQGIAREKGAIFVDGYSSVPHRLEYLTDHVHFTEEGARMLAAGIAKELANDRRFIALATQTGSLTCNQAAVEQ